MFVQDLSNGMLSKISIGLLQSSNPVQTLFVFFLIFIFLTLFIEK